ncbi:hypothetical protein T4E_3530, partial [Trichinella pseudospiralis]
LKIYYGATKRKLIISFPRSGKKSCAFVGFLTSLIAGIQQNLSEFKQKKKWESKNPFPRLKNNTILYKHLTIYSSVNNDLFGTAFDVSSLITGCKETALLHFMIFLIYVNYLIINYRHACDKCFFLFNWKNPILILSFNIYTTAFVALNVTSVLHKIVLYISFIIIYLIQ